MPLLKVGLCHLLTQNVVTSLANIGIVNVLDFICGDLEETVCKSGVSFKDLSAIRKILLAQHAPFPLNGIDLYEDVLNNTQLLPTQCKSLNDLLDGGFYSGELTEIAGKAGAGKTQICLSTSVSVAKDVHHNVFYVDTCGGFDIQRIQDILEAHKLPDETFVKICKRVKCCRVFDVFELLAQLESLHQSLTEQTDTFYGNLKLVIVDNVASVLSPILGGQNTSGHIYMMHVGRMLKTMAVEYGIAVVVTNNVTFDEHGDVRPSLGRSWRNIPNVRLLINRKQLSETNPVPVEREIVMTRSTRQPLHGRATFMISDKGLESLALN